jgi:Mn-dependent DtxR family transcriptional regulator
MRNTTRGWNTGITGTRMKADSSMTKVLRYIDLNQGATKYECLTEALGYSGTKSQLRGTFSCMFQDLKQIGVCDYNSKTYKYTLTEKGERLLAKALERL